MPHFLGMMVAHDGAVRVEHFCDRVVASVQAGFSDYHAEIQDIVAEGSMLVARVQWTGTQDGPFLGKPPTGNKLRFSTADFFRIENGKFTVTNDRSDRDEFV